MKIEKEREREGGGLFPASLTLQCYHQQCKDIVWKDEVSKQPKLSGT